MIDNKKRTTALRWLLAVVVALALAGCDFFDSGDASDDTVPPPTLVADAADPAYVVVDGGGGTTAEIYRDAGATEAAETLYANPASGERIRVYAAGDGTPLRVYDEGSGSSLIVVATGADRVDYRAYDSAGNWTGGYALLARSDGLYVAPVLGSPSFAGQISGQLTGAVQTGSYALTATADAALGTAVAVSTQAQDLAAALTPAMVTGQRARPLALPLLDARAVVAGLAMGVTVGSGNVPALAAGAMTAYALQRIGLQIADGGSIASALLQLADTVNTLFDRFNRGSAAIVGLGDALAGISVPHIQGATLRAPAGGDVRSPRKDPSTLPPTTALPPQVDTAVGGSGVDQDGTNYALTGVVTAAHALRLTLSDLAGGAGIDLVATLVGDDVSGTITGRLGPGTVIGRRSDPGPCATLQQSGGQGTFSYAFNTGGATGGTFDFYREAYTIPDAFRVVSNNQVLLDTGPVSGNDTTTLTLVGSATLFVNVNAPTSGTAWQFIVGCPS